MYRQPSTPTCVRSSTSGFSRAGKLRRGGLRSGGCWTDFGAMNIFDRKINFDALLKFSHITPSTQQHLKKVYASFALCMFVAAAGAYVHVVTHFIQAGLLSALGSLALMIWLMATPHSHETEQKRLGLLAGFAFLTGMWPGCLVGRRGY